MTSQALLPSAQSYSKTAKTLHWVIAVFILVLLLMGFLMGKLEFGSLKMNVIMLHKSAGITVLGLVILRLVWRFFHPPPKSLTSHSGWEKALSGFIHFFLYAAMLAMPLSGWIMSSAAEYPVNFYGLVDLPLITAKDEALAHWAEEFHEILAILLYLAVGLHFVGAAKHHFLDKDQTLVRMGGNAFFIIIGAVLLLGVSFMVGSKYLAQKPFYETSSQEQSAPQLLEQEAVLDTASDQAELQNADTMALDAVSEESVSVAPNENLWTIVPEGSYIRFRFSQYGQPVEGQFSQFKGRIVFDPDNLTEADADIMIDAASITTGSSDRDVQAKSDEWFGVEEYPLAVFQSESFSYIEENQYTARGNLTIRGQTLPIVLPFSLEISENEQGVRQANMKASISLMRLDFGVGQGEWESTATIGDDVDIDIEILAVQ